MKAICPTLKISNVKTPVPEENEARIRVSYFTLSFEDCQAYDIGVSPIKLGAAFTGIIDRVPAHESRFTVGGQVMGFKTTGGAMAEYITCDVSLLIPVPPSLTLKDAVMIPEMWVSAIQLLKHEVGFVKRERLAVFGANCPLGLVITQLAQVLGCRRVHCIGDPIGPPMNPKVYALRASLPDEVVIYEDPDQASAISCYDPKGLEAIIDVRASPVFNFHMLRPQGRMSFAFSSIRGLETAPAPIPLALMNAKNIRLTGSCIRAHKPTSFQTHLSFIEEHIIPKIVNRQILGPNLSVHHWSEVSNILGNRNLQSKVHIFSVS